MILTIMKFANRGMLVDFINQNNIKRENIQLIVDEGGQHVLYYWYWTE